MVTYDDHINITLIYSLLKNCVLGQCYLDGINYEGNNIRSIADIGSLDNCQTACFAEPSCIVWTYLIAQQKCYLKRSFGDKTNIFINTNYMSGYKACNADSKYFYFLQRYYYDYELSHSMKMFIM